MNVSQVVQLTLIACNGWFSGICLCFEVFSLKFFLKWFVFFENFVNKVFVVNFWNFKKLQPWNSFELFTSRFSKKKSALFEDFFWFGFICYPNKPLEPNISNFNRTVLTLVSLVFGTIRLLPKKKPDCITRRTRPIQ